MPGAAEWFFVLGLVASLSACAGTDPSNRNSASSESSSTSAPIVSTAPTNEQQSAGEKANAEFKDSLSGAALLSELKQGGYIIYFRHAQTDRDYADQADAKLDLKDCETQRKLSDVGIKQAQEIGAAFTAKAIPVGEVITSDYCRAWKTADLAFGKHQKDSNLNFLPFEEYTDEQVKEMKTKVMPLLIKVPEKGKNTVIVGHDDIFEAATGIYPDPQGIAYVLKPDGGSSFKLVANLLSSDWMKL
jgi:phosphohistidine phosphatase SixA